MEQEEAYIPYENRTPEVLCRDMNLKAEKLYLRLDKSVKRALVILSVAFVVLLALNLYFKWFVVNSWLFAYLGVMFVMFIGSYALFKIIPKLIHDMKCATSPQQHLQIAKKLKLCTQLRCKLPPIAINVLNVTMLLYQYLVAFVRYELPNRFNSFVFILLLVFVCYWGWRERNYHVNEGFCDDLDELEYKLNDRLKE